MVAACSALKLPCLAFAQKITRKLGYEPKEGQIALGSEGGEGSKARERFAEACFSYALAIP